MTDVTGTDPGPFPGTVRLPADVWVHDDGTAYVGRSPGTVGVESGNGREWHLRYRGRTVMATAEAAAVMADLGLSTFADVTDYDAVLAAAKDAGAEVTIGVPRKVAGVWRVGVVSVPATEVAAL